MVIPNTVTNGPFGKLLLFPIEMAGQLNSLLPEDLAAWKESVISSESLKRQLRTVELAEGRVKLHANDGRVRVDECAFFGDWVSRLAFSGWFDLAGGPAAGADFGPDRRRHSDDDPDRRNDRRPGGPP